MADLPWSQRLIQAHFDSGFLAQISPAEINSVLAQAPAPGGASLIRLLWQDPAQWPTVWYKGGSEPGVLTLGYLATNTHGQTFVVVAMLSDPAAALPPSAVLGLLAIAQGAFELIR